MIAPNSKALVLGFGSIGQRHFRLLGDLGLDVAVVSRRDVDVEHRYATLSSGLADWNPNYVVIASATHEHFDDLQELAASGFSETVLVEKPLFNKDAAVPAHSFSDAWVAYNLRFHPILQELRNKLENETVLAVHAYVGQYLPDWRPDTDYRDSYSAKKAQGGGVLRDLSHEMDYLLWMLGDWRRLTAVGGHFSHLEIDSDDVYSILFETERCPLVTLQMNYLDSKVHRSVVVLTDRGTIRADLVAGSLTEGDQTQEFPVARDDTYLAQHRSILFDEGNKACDLAAGQRIASMIDAAEHAAKEGKWVHV